MPLFHAYGFCKIVSKQFFFFFFLWSHSSYASWYSWIGCVFLRVYFFNLYFEVSYIECISNNFIGPVAVDLLRLFDGFLGIIHGVKVLIMWLDQSALIGDFFFSPWFSSFRTWKTRKWNSWAHLQLNLIQWKIRGKKEILVKTPKPNLGVTPNGF